MIGLRWVDEVGWANASRDVQGFDDTCLRWNSFKWKILGNLTFLGIMLRAKVAMARLAIHTKSVGTLISCLDRGYDPDGRYSEKAIVLPAASKPRLRHFAPAHNT